MEYNTHREQLNIKEYGRHIQKMVAHIKTLSDAAERQHGAETIIEVMGQLNPQLKNIEDFKHKLWDHLFIIADFDLDINSPYPIPSKATLQEKPDPLPYPRKYPKFFHLGKNIEYLIENAQKEKDPETQQAFMHIIIHTMKQIYDNRHKENISEDDLCNELKIITKGALTYTYDPSLNKHIQSAHPIHIREKKKHTHFNGQKNNYYKGNGHHHKKKK